MSALARISSCGALLVLGGLACRPAPSSSPPPAVFAVPAGQPAAAAEPAEPPPGAGPPFVLGHLRMDDPLEALGDLADLQPMSKAMMFNEAALRGVMSMMLEDRAALAEHFVFSRPMGCVLVQDEDATPLVCAFGYDGGVAQLVEDLGPNGLAQRDATRAVYRIGEDTLYFEGLDSHMMVGFSPRMSMVSDDLRRLVIEAPQGPADFESAFRLAEIFERLPAEVEEFLAAAAEKDPPTGIAELDEYRDVDSQEQRLRLESFRELELAELWLSAQPQMLQFGYRGTALPESATAAAYAGQLGRGLDQELTAMLPVESFFAGSMSFDVQAMAEDPMFGRNPDKVKVVEGSHAEALVRLFEGTRDRWQKMSTGEIAMGFTQEAGTLGGVVLIYRLPKGNQVMASMQQSADELRELSARDGSFFKATHKKGAFKVGRVKADVISVTMSDELMQDYRQMSVWPKIEETLGKEPALHIAYAQRRDLMFMTMSLQAPERYLRRLVAAADGKKNLGSSREAMAIFERHAADNMVLALDVREAMRWAVSVEMMEPPSQPLGTGRDDVLLRLSSPDGRHREAYLELSHDFMEQVLAQP